MTDFADVLRGEYCKLKSVRSTWWALLAAVVFNVLLAALFAVFLPGQLSAAERATLDTTQVSLAGLHLSQVAFAVLGVLAISSEYTSGTIRSSLAAVPQRRAVLAAKAVVFASIALVVASASCLAAYFTFEAFLAESGLRTSLWDPGVLRAVIGAGLFLTAIGLFGLGLGAVLRSSAGAIAALLGLMFVPPILLELVPETLRDGIGPYVPLQAGSRIFSEGHTAGALGPWTSFGLFCVYAAAALGAGFVLINRRDA